jgi:HEPN pEK499 p136
MYNLGCDGYRYAQPILLTIYHQSLREQHMPDRRTAIPALAYMNAQVMQHAVQSGQLTSSMREVERLYTLPKNSLRVINPAYLLSLLYCLIVVPQELWLKQTPPPAIAALDANHVIGLFVISLGTVEINASGVLRLIRHLRNAVAHARFSMEQPGSFTFWDQKGENAPKYFQASISEDNLAKFLSLVGAALANLQLSTTQIS